MGNIVWSAEQGWHDGQAATLGLDGNLRIVAVELTRTQELRRRVRGIELGPIWVCQCCYVSDANGECCADDQHGGDGNAPWSTTDFTRYGVTAGLTADEHSDYCEVRRTGRHDFDCDCERTSFSHSRCDGCGSYLAGERFAMTLWREPQRFASGISTVA